MKLPFHPGSDNSRLRDYLVALEITDRQVKCALWAIANDKVQVISVGQPYPWEDQNPDSLLSAADKSLSEASDRLDSASQVRLEKVIFGLPQNWLDAEKISLSRTGYLKTICQKLSLRPVGFVISPEAIVQYLSLTEGVHPTAILVGVETGQFLVTLCRLGKIQGIEKVVRSSQPAADLAEGLSRFLPADMLPSRILLYDSSAGLEDIRQNLLAFPWQAPQNHLPFLHFPKVDLLPPDFSIKAVAIAGGSEVAKASGWLDLPSLPPDNSLGFVENADIAEQMTSQLPAAPPQNPVPRKKISLPRLPRLPRLPHLRFSRLLFFLSLPLLAVLAGLAYWFLPRARITLFLTPRTVSGQFEIMAPYKKTEIASQAEKSLPTTGSVLVGDKALGTVNIINGTPVTHSFPAGTEIVAPNGGKFTLDEKVTVASASGTADPNSYSPGKASVAVTAAQIGSDSNLSAGTQFRINSFSTLDYVAKNDQAFSGGSTRQAQAVSRQDLAGLRTQVSDLLSQDIQKQLDSLAGSDDVLVRESLKTDVVSETLSNKEGEIADSVSLKRSVKTTAYFYSQSQLNSLVADQLQPLYPEKYLPAGDPKFTLKIQKTDADNLYLSVQVSSPAVPDIKSADLLPQLVGKKLGPARQYLSGLAGVAKADIVLQPPFPEIIAALPRISDHITFNTEVVAP